MSENTNYEKFIPTDLTPDHILYKSLDMVICDKLKKDKYYCVTNIIDGISKDYMNKILKVEFSKPNIKIKKIYNNEKKNNFSTHNTFDILEIIFHELNTNIINIEYARCIIYLYLNQEKISNLDYTNLIYKTLIKSDILNENDYIIENDYILLNYNIKLNEITDLSDFTTSINEISTKNNNDELFFRGHSNTNFMATPTLFRDNYYKNEYEMFHELVIRCQENFYNCRYRFEFISLMQHYGLPTRLLDVTLNPLVALYFACENCSSDVAEVLVYKVPKDEIKHSKGDTVSILSNLSMFKFEEQKKIYQKDTTSLQNLINQINVEKTYFNESIISKKNLNEPVFIIPERDNRRIINQKGAFVLFGLNNELYGDSNNNNDSNNYKFLEHRVERILFINSNNKNKIMNQLKLFGIDKSFIYPEIDDVAEDIKNQYSQR